MNAPEPIRYASAGRRILAWLIDSLLLLVLSFFVFSVLDSALSGYTYDRQIKAFLGCLVLWLLHDPLFETLNKGQTLGKKAMRIVVKSSNGLAEPHLGQSLVRMLFKVLDLLLLGIPALIVMTANMKSRRIGDLAAGTVVISTD